MIDVLGYVASAAILVVYLLLAAKRVRPIVFHWANALGWPPVVASELAHDAYVPLVLTVFFGAIGTLGVSMYYLTGRKS